MWGQGSCWGVEYACHDYNTDIQLTLRVEMEARKSLWAVSATDVYNVAILYSHDILAWMEHCWNRGSCDWTFCCSLCCALSHTNLTCLPSVVSAVCLSLVCCNLVSLSVVDSAANISCWRALICWSLQRHSHAERSSYAAIWRLFQRHSQLSAATLSCWRALICCNLMYLSAVVSTANRSLWTFICTSG